MIWIFIYVSYLILFMYAVTQLLWSVHWLLMRRSVPPVSEQKYYSVIIPYRNEITHLAQCLESLVNQEYNPNHFELLFVDDHSTDGSTDLVNQLAFSHPHLNIRNISSQLRGKKNALNTGIENAVYDHIITTDADTTRGEYWLRTCNNLLVESNSDILVGTVLLLPARENAFHYFQALDYMGLSLITTIAGRSGWFSNGSGANLIFRKDIYTTYKANEFNSNITSGDDVFFLESARSQGRKILYPKENAHIVFSETEPDWSSLINQRLRWGAKSFSYRSILIPMLWSLPVISSMLILLQIMLNIVFPDINLLRLLLYSVTMKLVADFCLLKVAHDFYKMPKFRFFLVAELYHLIYLSTLPFYILTGRKFSWKGQKHLK